MATRFTRAVSWARIGASAMLMGISAPKDAAAIPNPGQTSNMKFGRPRPSTRGGWPVRQEQEGQRHHRCYREIAEDSDNEI